MLPDWWPQEESLRVLYGCNWNYERAYNDCMLIVTWRASILPIALEEAHVRLLKSGFFTVFGRDKYGRGVGIIRPLSINRSGITDHLVIMQACCFVMFYSMNHMNREGHVESCIVICDLENAQPWTLPIRALQSYNVTMQQ